MPPDPYSYSYLYLDQPDPYYTPIYSQSVFDYMPGYQHVSPDYTEPTPTYYEQPSSYQQPALTGSFLDKYSYKSGEPVVRDYTVDAATYYARRDRMIRLMEERRR